MYVIYDIETTISCFIVVIRTLEGKEVCYEISKFKNDYQKIYNLWKSLIDRDCYFIGFNNIGFDAQVMEYILKEERTFLEIYKESQRVINLSDDERYEETIPEYKLSFKNIDLYKIYHFDNINRRTSWTKNLAKYKPI